MADTIAAVSTGQVLAAIGILRLSGDDTLAVVDRVFFPSHGRKMSERPDRQLVFGELHDKNGDTIDICLCTISRGPGSYTGEDTAEIQCHGSPTVLREGLDSLFAAGARQALAGEFTKRAFLNGRMDLTQAEAVIDLIHAESAECAKNAAGQLGGAIQRRADGVYDALRDISAHYHAVIDYPDDDIEEFTLSSYGKSLETCESTLAQLLDSFERGRLMQGGVPAAIVGRPNAGKSSLLNALLGYERAIVTAIPGTTRDTIEERVRFGGVTLRLADTAGVRETRDEVERLGVERSRAAMRGAELIFVLIDGTRPVTPEDKELIHTAQSLAKCIVLLTKSDLGTAAEYPGAIRISSRTSEGFDRLEAAVSALFPDGGNHAVGEILTNARQAEAVQRALESVRAARGAMAQGFLPDLVLTETENAMAAIGELTGKTVREDITARIFERFCVGK